MLLPMENVAKNFSVPDLSLILKLNGSTSKVSPLREGLTHKVEKITMIALHRLYPEGFLNIRVRFGEPKK